MDLAAPPAPARPPREGVAEVAALGRAFDTMLVRLAAERQDSARAAIAAQERERARIGRELHDEVGQALTGVALELRAGELEAAQEALTAAADGVREIMQGLRPEVLEDFGLRGALLALASAFAERTGVSPRRDLEQLPALPEETELVVYRVVQEALTNVARHAGASARWCSAPGTRATWWCWSSRTTARAAAAPLRARGWRGCASGRCSSAAR